MQVRNAVQGEKFVYEWVKGNISLRIEAKQVWLFCLNKQWSVYPVFHLLREKTKVQETFPSRARVTKPGNTSRQIQSE